MLVTDKAHKERWEKGVKLFVEQRRARAARDGLGWCAFGGLRHDYCHCRRTEHGAGIVSLIVLGLIAAALLIGPIFEGLRKYAEQFPP